LEIFSSVLPAFNQYWYIRNCYKGVTVCWCFKSLLHKGIFIWGWNQHTLYYKLNVARVSRCFAFLRNLRPDFCFSYMCKGTKDWWHRRISVITTHGRHELSRYIYIYMKSLVNKFGFGVSRMNCQSLCNETNEFVLLIVMWIWYPWLKKKTKLIGDITLDGYTFKDVTKSEEWSNGFHIQETISVWVIQV